MKDVQGFIGTDRRIDPKRDGALGQCAEKAVVGFQDRLVDGVQLPDEDIDTAVFQEGNNMREAVKRKVFEGFKDSAVGFEKPKEEFGQEQIEAFLMEKLKINPKKAIAKALRAIAHFKFGEIPGVNKEMLSKENLLANLYRIYSGEKGKKMLEGLHKILTEPRLFLSFKVKTPKQLFDLIDANKIQAKTQDDFVHKADTYYMMPFIEKALSKMMAEGDIEIELLIGEGAESFNVKGDNLEKILEDRVEQDVYRDVLATGCRFTTVDDLASLQAVALNEHWPLDFKRYTVCPTDAMSNTMNSKMFVTVGWGGEELYVSAYRADGDFNRARFRVVGGGKIIPKK